MKSIITIAQYDLLRSVKERESFLIGLLMPALMMLLLGLAQSNNSATIYIDVVDNDHSDLSRRLVALYQEQMSGEDASFVICPYDGGAPDGCGLPETITSSTANDRLENIESSGLLVIPAGFGDALKAGEDAAVEYRRSGDLNAPTLAEQQIQSVLSQMNGSLAIARVTLDTLPADQHDAAFDIVLDRADAAWQQRPVAVQTEATTEDATTNGFNQSGPGMALMFVFIFVLNAATMLVADREIGTLQRLYTLPMGKWHIIAGKLLGRYLFGVLQFTILIVVGTMMGVEWGSNVPGIVLIVIVFTFTSTALGLLLATIVKTSAQAGNIALLMGLTLAPLGGAWWPMEIVPNFMQIVGHLSPIAWGMDAFGELMYYGGGVIDILPQMGALLLMGAIFFALGVRSFRYE
jgi:ABC-2 type transport system permease protein